MVSQSANHARGAPAVPRDEDGPTVEAWIRREAHPNPNGRRFSAGAQSARSPRPSSKTSPTQPRTRWTGVRAAAMSWPRKCSNGDCRASLPRSGLSWWRHCKDFGPWADTPGSAPATGRVCRADWSFGRMVPAEIRDRQVVQPRTAGWAVADWAAGVLAFAAIAIQCRPRSTAPGRTPEGARADPPIFDPRRGGLPLDNNVGRRDGRPDARCADGLVAGDLSSWAPSAPPIGASPDPPHDPASEQTQAWTDGRRNPRTRLPRHQKDHSAQTQR